MATIPRYRRLPNRKQARGRLVSLVVPAAQLRAAKAFATAHNWALSEVLRVSLAQFLSRQTRRK